METRPAAIVLDMDGLMFNTEDLYDEVTRVVLGRRGRDFSLELKRKLMGRPAAFVYPEIISFCQLEDPVERLQQEVDELWLERMPAAIGRMPGLEWLMETADQLAIPLAVATSSSRNLALAAIGHFRLTDRFRAIVTGEEVQNGKPAPDIYLHAAERLGVASHQMLVFEDSLIGSRAGVASGAATIAVPGHHNRDQDFTHVWRVAESLDDEWIRALSGQWK